MVAYKAFDKEAKSYQFFQTLWTAKCFGTETAVTSNFVNFVLSEMQTNQILECVQESQFKKPAKKIWLQRLISHFDPSAQPLTTGGQLLAGNFLSLDLIVTIQKTIKNPYPSPLKQGQTAAAAVIPITIMGLIMGSIS